MFRLSILLFHVFLICNLHAQNESRSHATLLIRCDDIGINNSVNMALSRLIEKNIPLSASIIVNAPQFDDAVSILKRHPEVSVGVHLALNCEWNINRWGPILDRKIVPSLVDSNGFFFPTRKDFFLNDPKLEEIEKELTAQVEKALATGIKIDYLDYHLSTAVSTPELQLVVRKIARKFNIALSDYYNEINLHVYATPVKEKKNELLRKLEKTEKGKTYLLIVHIGLNSEEMRRLVDLNTIGVTETGLNREEELNILCSPEFQNVIKENKLSLSTYRQLSKEMGVIN